MKDRHGANEVFLSTENGIGEEDIDRILDAGQRRTNALNDSITKALPSDEQLLNFKLDHTSVLVFEGVDYTEKKKEREKELVHLVYEEATLQQSRRNRKVELSGLVEYRQSHTQMVERR